MVWPVTREFPDPAEQPLLPLWPDAGRWLDIGKTVTYRLSGSGEFPVEVLKIGGQLKVRTADLRRYLGLDA